MDFSHWGLFSNVRYVANVRYVSENNLKQILLSPVEYKQKAQKTTLKMKMSTKMKRTKNHNTLKKQFLIKTFQLNF